MDDFGTGYSGLSYLGRFPHAQDRPGLRVGGRSGALHGDIGDRDVVAAVIALEPPSRCGSSTTEGVETHEQLRFMLDHGCDGSRVTWFSPPVDPEGFSRCCGWSARPTAPTASAR